MKNIKVCYSYVALIYANASQFTKSLAVNSHYGIQISDDDSVKAEMAYP